jgi:hypothetical protein
MRRNNDKLSCFYREDGLSADSSSYKANNKHIDVGMSCSIRRSVNPG